MFVAAALGLFPVTAGSSQFQIGSPFFDSTTITYANGTKFTVKADGDLFYTDAQAPRPVGGSAWGGKKPAKRSRGPARMFQVVISKPFSPDSSSVGMSGNSGCRRSDVHVKDKSTFVGEFPIELGHILEESNSPMAVEIWQRVEDEATAHIRPGAR